MLRSIALTAAVAALPLAAAAADAPPVTKLPGGVTVTVVKAGTGAKAVAGKIATVNYTGTLDNGTTFDSSRDPGRRPFSFSVGAKQVIPCWDEAVATMHVGERVTVVCPPGTAYGDQGAGGVIPPNATLHFDIELLSVD